jgi:hypothetical protein
MGNVLAVEPVWCQHKRRVLKMEVFETEQPKGEPSKYKIVVLLSAALIAKVHRHTGAYLGQAAA